ATLFSEGQAGVSLVAAVPSLHVAFCALVAFFLWSRISRRWLRPLLLLYPLAMGFTLISTGEHYFFDVALGWVYAGLVMTGWSRWEERRELRVAMPSGPPGSGELGGRRLGLRLGQLAVAEQHHEHAERRHRAGEDRTGAPAPGLHQRSRQG